MPKTAKTTKRNLKVKSLPKAEKELSQDEAKRVKGGFVIYGRGGTATQTDIKDGTSNTILVSERIK
jgi:hypothetical protein